MEHIKEMQTKRIEVLILILKRIELDQETSSWEEAHRKETHLRGKEDCCINLNLFIP